MTPADAEFVQKCVRRYYFERFSLVEIPDRVEQREFGYRKHGSGMIRHIQLNKNELLPLLVREAPTDVYVSNARYLFPALPLPDKEWQEADIIFDIDAKDLELECRPSHTVYACPDCGRAGAESGCRSCGSGRTSSASLPCGACTKGSKGEVEKLLEILGEDLGIDSGVRVYFSGNEGFHVHVEGSQLAAIGSRERSELSDYVRLRGMIPDSLGVKRGGATASSLPRLNERGWRGRFARELFGSKSKRSKQAPQLARGGYAAMEGIIENASKKMGVRIDPHVTMDVHRIFRMPGTINGKSGLVKMRCADLLRFDPYSEAALIEGEQTRVRASCPVRFGLGGKKFGPYNDEPVDVPAFAAAYMVCKGMAHVEGP